MQNYEFLPHTSEIKFRAHGKTLNEALENAVLAVASFIAKDNETKPKKAKIVQVSGTDKENLLYKLIEEQISLIDTENFLTAKAQISVLGNNLKVEFFGDEASNYKGLGEIKSPTYSEIYVKETENHNWDVQMVLDI
ncbi:MAG: archease [archaeon]